MQKITFFKKINFYFVDLMKQNLKINILQIILSLFINFSYMILLVSIFVLIKNIFINKIDYYLFEYNNYSINLIFICFLFLFLVTFLIFVYFKTENYYQNFLIKINFLKQKDLRKFLVVFFHFKLNIVPNILLFFFTCILILLFNLKMFIFLMINFFLILLILKNKKKNISNIILKSYKISPFNIQFYSIIINLFVLLFFVILVGIFSKFINMSHFSIILLLMIFSLKNIVLHSFKILRSKKNIEDYFDFKASKFKNI
jgi:hypothetical protein